MRTDPAIYPDAFKIGAVWQQRLLVGAMSLPERRYISGFVAPPNECLAELAWVGNADAGYPATIYRCVDPYCTRHLGKLVSAVALDEYTDFAPTGSFYVPAMQLTTVQADYKTARSWTASSACTCVSLLGGCVCGAAARERRRV